jgi:hypothetical protein
MSLVLLIGAGLFVRTQYRLLNSDTGIESSQVLVVEARAQRTYTDEASWSFHQELERQVRTLPGVQSAPFATSLPISDGDPELVRLPGQAKGAGRAATVNAVTPGSLRRFKFPILRGQPFEETDASTGAASSIIVVSENFASAFWPGENPLGKYIQDSKNNRLEVAAVVRSGKSELSMTSGSPRFYRIQNRKSFGGPLLGAFQRRFRR